jgi:hypothetical protein
MSLIEIDDIVTAVIEKGLSDRFYAIDKEKKRKAHTT